MSPSLTDLAETLDMINERIGRFLGLMPLLLVLLQFLIIVLAAGFDLGSIKLQESLQYINALMFLGAAGYTMKHNEHVRVDLVYNRLSQRGKDWVDFLGIVFLLIPFVTLLWISGISYANDSWAIFEKSIETSGLPFVYLLKSIILLFCLTLSIQVISSLSTLSLRLFAGMKNND